MSGASATGIALLLALGGCGAGKLNAPQRGVLEGDTGAMADGDGTGANGGGEGEGAGEDGGDGVAEHCGTLTADESWGPPGATHRLRCTVTVAAGTLTLEPGVTVVAATGESLIVGGEGAEAGLQVAGEADAPVVLAGESGSWGGLRVLAGAEATLSHLELRDGGTTNRGGLHVDGATVAVDGLAVSGAPGCGLRLQGGAALGEGARGLVLTGNGQPACAWIESVQSLPGAAAGSDYTGNATDQVRVMRGELSTSAHWTDLGVPLRIEDTIELGGSAAAPAVLSLDPGTVLAFADGTGITVGAGGKAAGLALRGTAAAPVVLQGGDSAAPGSWGQLALESGSLPEETVLEHVVVEHGGARGLAMVEVSATTLPFAELTLRDCTGDALGVHPDAHLDGEGLAISGCDAPLFLAPSGVGELADVQLQLGDFETAPWIRVWGRTEADATLSAPTTWPDVGTPYRVERTVKLLGEASLVLEAGVDLRFATSAGLEAGTGAATGGLRIAGTAERPVHLGAADAERPGAWAGVRIGAGADPETSDIAHLELAYAGRGRRAALWVDGAQLRVSATHVRDVDPDACAITWSDTTPEVDGVTYENTPGGELCVE